MRLTCREGLALPLALAGVVLVGLLAASGLFLAGQERRAGRQVVLTERAFAAADLALGSVVAEWDPRAAGSVAVGSGWQLHPPVEEGRATVAVTRLAARTFWAVADGHAAHGGTEARRRLNAVIRVAVPVVPVGAALTSGGPFTLASGARVSGLPAGACVAPGTGADTAAGLLVARDADAAGDRSGITGAPPVRADPGLHLAAAGAGGALHDTIAVAAGLTLAAGARPTPSLPLDGTVHAEGDLQLDGAHRGEGILVVDGTLAIRGRLEYSGLLIVGGRLDVTGELALRGAAIVAGRGAEGGASRLGPGSVVQYGRCEIDRALTGAGRPVVARERGWADLF